VSISTTSIKSQTFELTEPEYSWWVVERLDERTPRFGFESCGTQIGKDASDLNIFSSSMQNEPSGSTKEHLMKPTRRYQFITARLSGVFKFVVEVVETF
jgi:hypothetical protein